MFNKSSDKLNSAIISENITFCNDFCVNCLQTVDSTNTYAKKMANQFHKELLIVAAQNQTMGRGRLGRSFFSSENGIYFSMLIKVPNLYQSVPFITTAAAVSVCKVIREISGKDARIKWVNDIYLGNKKICGILSEIADDNHAVVGVGINFYNAPFPCELETIAASLFEEESPVSKNYVIAEIANEFIKLIHALPKTSFLEDYRKLSMVIGKDITYYENGEGVDGKALDIDPSGGLIVLTGSEKVTLNTGEITVRVKAQNPKDQT